MRNVFEDAISRDRYDGTVRMIFADWLDEHGFHEEADEQRRWTPEWQRAEDWFVEFGVLIAEGNAPFSVSAIVEVGRKFVDERETTLMGAFDGFGATNAWDFEVGEAFWKHWQAYTRRNLDKKSIGGAEKDNCPFHCCNDW